MRENPDNGGYYLMDTVIFLCTNATTSTKAPPAIGNTEYASDFEVIIEL